MLLILVLGVLCTTAADDLVEDVPPPPPPVPPNCNCTRVLQGEEVTDPPPPFPLTSFTCWGRYDGYYADIEVDCTIFHYCQTWHYPTGLNETVKWDFACPQSTIFNQKILSCTPPSISFDCQESPNYYWVNYNFTSSSTSMTPTPTSEYTTPHSNFGQQLIVGGLGPQSAALEEPTDSTDASEQPSGGSYSEQPPNTSHSEHSPSTSYPEQPPSTSNLEPESSNSEQLPSSTHPAPADPPTFSPVIESHSGFDQPPGDLNDETASDIISFPK